MGKMKIQVLLMAIFLGCFSGCGEEPDDFDKATITAARLDNLRLSWKGAGYGDITGVADLVVTDSNGEELTRPVNIFGGVLGSVAGGADANKIWPDAEPIHADFFIPTLPDAPAATFEDVELSDGGVAQREVVLDDDTGDETELLKAAELFGPYFGGQAGMAFVIGWDAQLLFKGTSIQLALGHPTFGLGMAIGLEWLAINKR